MTVKINGAKIVELRKKLNMTREELGRMLTTHGFPCSLSTLRSWEKGTLSPAAVGTLYGIADALSVDIRELLDATP